jgi:probable F420-dependent oxidoreductase
MRPFRFGLIMTSVESRKAWAEAAKRVEDSGFSVLLVPDHFALPVAPVPAMLAAAEATTVLRVGSYVLANDFRHPAVLAKEAATLDLLTDGRFELGLGAGWNGAEYRRAGIPFESGRVRFERLNEAVRVIKALLDSGSADFDGTHYRTEGLPCPVRTVQTPLPLLLGGGGRRMLRFAAEQASIVGLMGAARDGAIDMSTVSEQATLRRIGWIRDAAGARFDQIELNVFVFQARLTEDRAAAVETIARDASLDPALVAASPHYLLGTREQMREQLLRLRAEHGLSYFAFFDRDLPMVAPVVAQLAAH